MCSQSFSACGCVRVAGACCHNTGGTAEKAQLCSPARFPPTQFPCLPTLRLQDVQAALLVPGILLRTYDMLCYDITLHNVLMSKSKCSGLHKRSHGNKQKVPHPCPGRGGARSSFSRPRRRAHPPGASPGEAQGVRVGRRTEDDAAGSAAACRGFHRGRRRPGLLPVVRCYISIPRLPMSRKICPM